MSTAPPPVTTPPPEPPRRGLSRTGKWLFGILLALLGLTLALGLALLLILPSQWFRDKVRTRIVYEVERASGGRVEIGSFSFDWSSMTAEVAPFILHGKEPAGEAPLLRAESIRVGLKIVSAFKRDIDIAQLSIEQPKVNLLVDASGITNLPEPKIERKSDKDPVQQLLDLAIREISIRQGEIHYGDRRIPLDVRGRYLNSKIQYELAGPAYQGTLAMQEVTATEVTHTPIHFAMDTRFRLTKNRVEMQRARVAMKESSIEASGLIEDLKNPRISADVTANGYMAELGPILKLPQPHTGHASFNGKVAWDASSPLRVTGRVTGQHFAIRQGRIGLQNISLTSDLALEGKDLKLTDLTVHALDGIFRGAVQLSDLEKFKVNGALSGVSIRSLTRMSGIQNANFAGVVEGPVEVTGSLRSRANDVKAAGKFKIAARQDGMPVKGFVEAAYSQRGNTVQLGNSWLELPHSRLDVRGTLGNLLTVKLESKDLEDFRPAMAMALEKVPEKFPVALTSGGSALFEGTVAGPLDRAKIAGSLTMMAFRVQDQQIDRLMTTFDATSSGVHAASLAVGQETLRLIGNADIGLQNWRLTDASEIAGALKLQGAQLSKLLKQAGQKDVPVEGMLSASINLKGTAGQPQAALKVNVDKPLIYEEQFDRFTGEVNYQSAGIEVLNGLMTQGSNHIQLTGTYTHPPDDLRTGKIRFNVATDSWRIEQVKNIAKMRPGLAGQIQVKLAGELAVRNGEISPESVNGNLAAKGLEVDRKPIGDANLDARTNGQQVTFALAGNFRGSQVNGKGELQLAGDYPVKGDLNVPPLQFSTIQDLVLTSQGKEPLPLDGTVEGHVTFSGPAKKPEAMQARVEIPQFQVVPSRRTLNPRQKTELSLKNQGPIVVDYDGKALNVRSAHLVGPETDIQATGAIFMREKSPVDVKLNGTLNLGVLQDFDRDLVTSGSAVINASVRGSMQEPQFGGRLEFKEASLYMTDFPNGLDHLNGTILFDQRRATIEKLQAMTGGGDLQLSGFVGLGRNELLYRLQARADRVRLRYPEGVSATANANLSLTGTSSKSLLSGVVTIIRAGFNPKADAGGLLASAPTPVAGPGPQNEYLRNMALEIRVETIPNLQFQTSLTANIQADADLRLRGNAAKPVVLGRMLVSQGEVEFFGNKYTITRGEIGFFNPVRIEPQLDVNVETKARGVDVSISLTGTMKKLNFSYRSDPPLQTNEIIALLAMGRAPGSNSSLASGQTVSNTSVLTTGTNSLLGAAVANPVSNRLQRFFGVSKLKIDPQLTGLSNVPQARVTIEQQVSRDITLTYVSNLAQANQQIIRLEWNLSKTWSVVAVREENGVFGVDFFFKKRIH